MLRLLVRHVMISGGAREAEAFECLHRVMQLDTLSFIQRIYLLRDIARPNNCGHRRASEYLAISNLIHWEGRV